MSVLRLLFKSMFKFLQTENQYR